jgi:hypothetical protein
VDELDTGADSYLVRLFVEQEGGAWLEQEAAASSIPAPLAPPETFGLPPGDDTPAAIQALLVDENTDESAAFEKIGTHLHGLLFAGAVGDAWQRLVDEYPGTQGAEGRRLLLDVCAEALARLPWELIRRPRDMPLFLDPSNPCARVSPSFPRAEPDLACTPIRRVLVLLGVALDEKASREDKKVEAKLELDQLHEAFLSESFSKAYGLADVEVLDRPELATIRDTFATFQPQVFHFIGHGSSRNESGELIIGKREGMRGYRWTTQAISGALRAWRPRVAIINACRSQNPAQAQQGSWEVSEVFLKMGVPAVLAMQGDIRGDAAARLTRPLYEQLVSGVPIDVALAAARDEIATELSWDRRDAWLPCLTLSVAPERVLPRQFEVEREESRAIVNRFAPLTFFVDNKEHRRRLFQQFAGTPGSEPSGPALALVGPAGIGKTELLKWLLGAYALVGGNVAYVDLDGKGNHDVRSVLAAIYTQLSAAPRYGRTNSEALAPFAQAAARLIGPSWLEEHRPDIDLESLFAALHTALGDVSPRPVVGVDHVEKIDAGHRAVIRERLVKPAGRELPVQLVVAADVGSAEDVLPAEIEADVQRIHLELREPSEYRELASRYMRAMGVLRERFERAVEIGAERDARWPLIELKYLELFVAGPRR